MENRFGRGPVGMVSGPGVETRAVEIATVVVLGLAGSVAEPETVFGIEA